MGPLQGLKILDLTRLQPGNYATMVLGDLGADVIKVEEPGRGDYIRWSPPMIGSMSAAHRILNRNKRSVTLNLKHPQGVEILGKLVSDADILIESFRPGVMERLGVGYEALAKLNPDLIYAAITGYGQDGPYRDRAGHDINYIAASGILEKTGQPDGPPVLPAVQIGDLAGAMMAVIGVLAALHRRQNGGGGEFVDVSMMDVSVSWLALHLASWIGGAPEMDRGDGYLNGGYPFYRVYRCGDGKYLSVGALEPQFWSALCTALDLEDLIPDQLAGGDRRVEIHGILEKTFSSKPRDEWIEILSPLDSCVAPVNDWQEMASDAQIRGRGVLLDRPLEEFPTWRTLGPAVKLSSNPAEISLEAPELGEHNVTIYNEYFTEQQVAGFESDGVI